MYRNESNTTLNSYMLSTNVQRLFSILVAEKHCKAEGFSMGEHFFILQIMKENWENDSKRLCTVVSRISRLICKWVVFSM